MLKKFFVLTMLVSSYAFASDSIMINFQHDSEQFEVSKIQMVYHSKNNVVCGRFDEGSVVSKIEFIDHEAAEKIEAEKEIRIGICTYKLSSILVLVLNPYNWPTQYVELPVLNSYNQRIFGKAPVGKIFNYSCQSSEDYGCEEIEEIASIDQNEISISIKSKN